MVDWKNMMFMKYSVRHSVIIGGINHVVKIDESV
jgi:hypothetical protein